MTARKTRLLDPLGSLQSTGGALFVVGTPIGNLEDVTLRALRMLKEVDLIACEDTRRTQKLLAHYGIKTPTLSYHEHNEITRAPELVIQLEQGSKVALVTDAGMPVVSDPGSRLVHLAVRHGIPVIPVPGATALVAALAASTLPAQQFCFVGFLPSKRLQRRRALESLARLSQSLVLYEAPHRLLEMLKDVREILGDRPVTVAREVTKVHEEFLRGLASEVLERLKKPVKGEITVVVGGSSGVSTSEPAGPSIQSELERAMAERSLNERGALKVVARARGISRSEAYRQLQMERSVTPGQRS